MINRELLKQAFLETIKVNDFSRRQIADACQTSFTRLDKSLYDGGGEHYRYPSEFMCSMVYQLAKRVGGEIPDSMQTLNSQFYSGVEKAASNHYLGGGSHCYIYDGQVVNKMQLSELMGISTNKLAQQLKGVEQMTDVTKIVNARHKSGHWYIFEDQARNKTQLQEITGLTQPELREILDGIDHMSDVTDLLLKWI